MTVVARSLEGLGRFLYGFVIGDDWVVAAVMLLALAVTTGMVANRIDAWWLVPPLAVTTTGVSLWRRRGPRAGGPRR
jgi:hypothetical protein